MFGLGTIELIVIGVIIFLIFGAKRIPEIGKGLGGAIKEFRNIKKEVSGENENLPDDNDPSTLEKNVTNKVMEQVPGVKTVLDVKKKVDQMKKIVG